MAMRQFVDAFGNTIEVDDEVSLLGPCPKDSPEAETPGFVKITYRTWDGVIVNEFRATRTGGYPKGTTSGYGGKDVAK